MTQPCLCCLTCPHLISLGGVLARLLEHPTISSVTLVEIDQRVVAASRRFFGFGPPPEPPSPRSTNPAWGVFGWAGFADNSECRAGRAGQVLPAPPGWGDGNEAVDGRVRLVLADGTAWVAAQPALPAEERYDVVVVDSTDFVLSSGGGSSWTADFYRSAPHSPGGLPASTAVPIAARPPQPFQSPHAGATPGPVSAARWPTSSWHRLACWSATSTPRSSRPRSAHGQPKLHRPRPGVE